MNTLLKVAAVILIVLGIVFCSMGTPYQGEMFWFGPYEEEGKSEGKRKARLAILGLILIGAGIGLFKFADIPN